MDGVNIMYPMLNPVYAACCLLRRRLDPVLSLLLCRRSSLIQFLAFFSAVGRSGSHRSGSQITSPPPSFGSQTSSPPSFGYLKLLLSSMWFIIELASSGRSAQSKFILPPADLIHAEEKSDANLWRFPDHESWVTVRVNSGSKQYFITNLKEVLEKFGLEKKFKEGPFGIYLKLKEPLTLYGQVIHNILKREINHPKGQREDEMWFGLGNSKARFGQEEFCLCSGLNMGQLPEGFKNNNEVPEDSMLRRIFRGKRPTAEVLYATLRKMTTEQSEDVYKMLNIYTVSQFFGTDDGRTTAILVWLFTLVEKEEEFKNFPWGSYIFSFTFYFLKGVLKGWLDRLRGQAKKEDKKGKL
ncbi:hypothetical protein LWI29_003325 [Acer saccharum]|uniref:DUF1985 domain-containing protein n=1 Tax=Acer saccharum TaxID=4024 RepID=A0AA39VD25_ACESA|nr:hypothetical protein LWI29_003325 [Acer saccharum]